MSKEILENNRKHYESYLGIGDVFLQPPQHEMPISYLTRATETATATTTTRRSSFRSTELVADIKTKPEDFIVQEIMDFSTITILNQEGCSSNLVKVASIGDDDVTLESRPLLQHQPQATSSKDSNPSVIVDWKAVPNDPKAALSMLLQHTTLRLVESTDQIVRRLTELHARTVAKLNELASTNVMMSKRDADAHADLNGDDAVIMTLRSKSDRQDRGMLHRWVRCAFPMLHTEVVNATTDSEKLMKIRVLPDDRFFGLSPFLLDPTTDIPLLYAFFRLGNDDQNGHGIHKRNGNHRERHRQQPHQSSNKPHVVLPLRVDLERSQRRNVHQIVSEKSGRQFLTDTNPQHEVSNDDPEQLILTAAIVVTWSKKSFSSSRKRKREGEKANNNGNANPDAFTLFVLRKRNVEHSAAVQCLSRALHCRPGDIQWAGIKDRQAITTQFCTIHGVLTTEQIVIARKGLPKQQAGRIDIGGPLLYVKGCLKKGQAQGNRFTLVLRNVCNVQVSFEEATGLAKETIIPCQERTLLENALARLDQHGFVNFYGEQRIGPPGVKVRAVDIGRALLQQQWEAAIDLILQTGTDANSIRVSQAWVDSKGDPVASWKALSKHNHRPDGGGGGESRQRVILQSLKRYGRDNLPLVLESVPHHDRTFWINAYQSLIWNSAATERLRVYGSDQVVVGDLVRDPNQDAEDPILVTSDEMAGRYVIYDVVLPLPGYRVKYPTNKVGKIYNNMLTKDEIAFAKDAPIGATAGGSYRRLVSVAQNLRHEWLDKSATYCRLVFDLPSGSYATILLRELFRTTMSR